MPQRGEEHPTNLGRWINAGWVLASHQILALCPVVPGCNPTGDLSFHRGLLRGMSAPRQALYRRLRTNQDTRVGVTSSMSVDEGPIPKDEERRLASLRAMKTRHRARGQI
jgi:hypothetical protein